MADERRRFPRFALKTEAEVHFTNWAVFRLIYTVNISRGGMNVELAERPALGSPLSLRLRPPTGPAILLEAVVRHVTPMAAAGREGGRFQVGLEFQNLDDERRAFIEKAINDHARTAH